MNNIVLSGRLTRESEIRYGGQDNSTAIARFTLAVDDGKETEYPTIKAIGRAAEWVEKWTKKGTKVELVGKIKTGSYTNKQGVKVYYTEVLINTIGFGESKAQAESRNTEPETSANYDGFMNIPDGAEDGLPFN